MTNKFQKLKMTTYFLTTAILLTACAENVVGGAMNDKVLEEENIANGEKTKITLTDYMIHFTEDHNMFERDKPNLQLVHNSKCHGLTLKAYAPKTLPLRNIQLPDHQLPDDYDQGNIYLSIAGDPKADVTVSNVLGTDWAIFDSNGGFLSFPQLDPGHIQTDRMPFESIRKTFLINDILIAYELTEVFSLYTNSKNLNLGRHKIQVSVPDLEFSDGQSCGFGGISFNLDLL